jgi:hypothetical protein
VTERQAGGADALRRVLGETRLAPGALAATIDELVPPLLEGLPPHEVTAVESHRAAGEARETLENLFIALAGYHRAVPAPTYALLGVLAEAVRIELPLLPVVTETGQRERPRGRPAGRLPHIAVMPDYQCFPLWLYVDDELEDNPAPSELPISLPLQEDLLAWADAYDATFDEDGPVESGFPSPQAAEDFDDRGRQLWGRLSDELRGTAVVTYRSVVDPR